MNLSFIQKRTICDIAQQAYDAWPEREAFERDHVTPGVQPFTAWRHQQQLAVVGLQSLSLCNQDHYRPLVVHFCKLRAANQAAANNLTLF